MACVSALHSLVKRVHGKFKEEYQGGGFCFQISTAELKQKNENHCTGSVTYQGTFTSSVFLALSYKVRTEHWSAILQIALACQSVAFHIVNIVTNTAQYASQTPIYSQFPRNLSWNVTALHRLVTYRGVCFLLYMYLLLSSSPLILCSKSFVLAGLSYKYSHYGHCDWVVGYWIKGWDCVMVRQFMIDSLMDGLVIVDDGLIAT